MFLPALGYLAPMTDSSETPADSRRDVIWLKISAIFILTRIILLLLSVFFMRAYPMIEGEQYAHLPNTGPALDMWYRWDAGYYTAIAVYGYGWQYISDITHDMAFFPLYPYAMQGTMKGIGAVSSAECVWPPQARVCATASGLIISNIALWLSTFLLYDLARCYRNKSVALRAVILLLITPGVIFFSGVYTESLFLLLCLLTFWFVERDRFLLAALFAGLACLTRPVGLALYPVLLGYAWRSPNHRWRRCAAAQIPVLCFGMYILSISVTVGDLGGYFDGYRVLWNREMSLWPYEVFAGYFRGRWSHIPGWYLVWSDLLATLLGFTLAILIWRRHKPWGVFALLAVYMPVTSGTLFSMPRYVMVIFPFYILCADWATTQRRQIVLYGIFAGLAILFTYQFVTWHWIA